MKKDLTIEKLFLIISILVGSLFIFIIPPFNSPDEDSHFKKSYMISEGKFFPKEKNKIIGYDVPTEIILYSNEKNLFMGNLDKKYSYKEMYFDMLLSSDYNKKEFTNFTTASINPIAHLIPGIGIFVGKFFSAFNNTGNISIANLLYFGRFFSLIAYSIVGFFAIKITPKYKKTMFTILLLPMSLFLRSMISYDGLLISVTALAVAKMLQLIYDEKVKFKISDYFLFTMLGYTLLNVKTLYSIFFVLMFFIPSNKFGNLKGKIKSFGIMIGSVLLLTFITKLFTIGLHTEQVEIIAEQYTFIRKHPFKTLYYIFYNAKNEIKVQSFWAFGTLGLLDTYLPPFVIYLNIFNLAFVTILEGLICKREKILIKVLMFILMTLSFAGVYLKMYADWTPLILNVVGGKTITGVQGRYFIPLFFGLPIVLGFGVFENKKKIKNVIENILSYYWIVPVISLLISLMTCLLRYWI